MGVGGLARFWEEDHITFLPEAGGIPKVEAQSVDHTQHTKDIGRKVEEENGLKAIGAWGLL